VGQRIEVLLGRVFLSLLVCVVCFAALERVSRRFFFSRPPIEQRYPVQFCRHPRPYSMFSGEPNARNLNEMGYRGKAPIVPKPRGEYRVFFLGGSTVFRGNPTIADLVEQRFHADGMANVRVYNFGVISSISGMELARTVFEVADLSPNLVVMYNGGNDLLHPWTWDPRPGYPFNFIAYENNPILDKDLKAYPAWPLFLYGSNVMRILLRPYFVERFVPLERVRTECGYKTPEWRERVADAYVGNVVKTSLVAKAFGADFIAFYQPMVYYKETLSDEEQLCGNAEEGEFARQVRAMVLSKIAWYTGEDAPDFVDLTSIYAGDTTSVFIDAIHTKQEAKPLVALAIYTHLARFVDHYTQGQ
jgi:hypothetical protein